MNPDKSKTANSGDAASADGPEEKTEATRPLAQSHRGLRHYSHTLQLLKGANRRRWLTAARGVVCGLLAGVLVVGYRLGIQYGTQFAGKAYGWSKLHPLGFLGWAAAIALATIIITRLTAWEPMASGSGIPQTEGTLLWGLKLRWWSVLIVRFVGGLLCSLFGLSLGREGPSIQIGAAASKAVGGKMSRNAVEENTLITSGAAAGLSAAFNAPLSGMMFALEEVHKSFSPSVLITAMTAALSSDVVSKYCFGLKPVLDFASVKQLPLQKYLWLLPLGLVAGLVGVIMNLCLLGFQTLYGRIPPYARTAVALVIALPCGLFLPLSLGGGANTIQFAERAQGSLALLCTLLVVKVLFTATSYSSGVPGGIFMPILAAGALSGSIFARIIILVAPGQLSRDTIPVFAVLAMAGALTAAVKAPITSILLVMEMSGSLVHMFPVAAVAFIALLVSDALHIKPIYPALLSRYMAQHEKTDISAIPAHSGMFEIPVQVGSVAAGKPLGSVEWPHHTDIITIRRGNQEFVPQKDSLLKAGDALIVLFSGIDERHARKLMTELCENSPVTDFGRPTEQAGSIQV